MSGLEAPSASNGARPTPDAPEDQAGFRVPTSGPALRVAVSRVLRCLALGYGLSLTACAPQPQERPVPSPPAASAPAPAPVDDARTQPAPRAVPHQGAPEAADRWDVDLQRDERRGGHTLARHVGRTDAQLQARLRRESISAASTYPDIATAERVVRQALDENATRVESWIGRRTPKPNLAIRHRARDAIPIGRVLDRGDTASHDARGAVVVLRWRDQGWYVLTSYPEDIP